MSDQLESNQMAIVSSRNFCYILSNTMRTHTYVGYTNNPCRRIRQHNGELAGGAKYTTRYGRKVGQDGQPYGGWEFAALISNPSPLFDNKIALSLEWHMKPHKNYNKTLLNRRFEDPVHSRIRFLEKAIRDHPKFADFNDFELYLDSNRYNFADDLLDSGRVSLVSKDQLLIAQ